MPQPMMQAISIEDNKLRLATLPVPQPRAGEVLICVAYAGLNHADLLQRQGKYPPPEGASPVPGLEVSGTIAKLGDSVSRWHVGDEVCALLDGGGYGEYCTAASSLCLPVPHGMSMEDAATLPEACATVWMSLFAEAQMKEGERVLIHGGASGIGGTAIQMVKAFGAIPVATTRNPGKAAFCESLGATVLVSTKTDIVEAVRALGGADIVLDMVGGDMIAKNISMLKPRGRMISLAMLAGGRPDSSLGGLLMKQLTWKGVTLRARSVKEKSNYINAVEEWAWPRYAQKKLTSVRTQTFALHNADKAQQTMQQGLHLGKIALKVQA